MKSLLGLLTCFLLISACSSDDDGGSAGSCDLYAQTLTGTFIADDDPNLTLSFMGDGISGTGTASDPDRTDMCTYRVENCTTGDVVGTCNGRAEMGSIRIIDRDNIVINNIFIENFLRGDRSFSRR